MDASQALAALTYLQAVARRHVEVQVACKDAMGERLCQTPATIRQHLASTRAWAVTRKDEVTELWLGEPGQIVTVVS